MSVSQTPLRVLIAEDEALIRLDLKEMLEEEGYAVVGEAGDGQAAIDLAVQHHPDLVILDVKMPVLDGISAAERIAAEHIAPVVILTAFSQRELVERARDAGAMAYLVKPFTKADLVPAIEIAVSRFQEVAALEGEVGTLKERLEVRKLLDRAKGKLQTEHGMTEPDAFRWIQKTSMDQRMAMRAVAERVLDGRRVPGGRGRERGSQPPVRRADLGLPVGSGENPGNLWCRVGLPRADMFSTQLPGLCPTTVARRFPGRKGPDTPWPVCDKRTVTCGFPRSVPAAASSAARPRTAPPHAT